jgi:hypothetical protein
MSPSHRCSGILEVWTPDSDFVTDLAWVVHVTVPVTVTAAAAADGTILALLACRVDQKCKGQRGLATVMPGTQWQRQVACPQTGTSHSDVSAAKLEPAEPVRVKLKPGTNPNSLDAKQQHILDLCLTGRNVFFTGLAVTGKTFLLRHIAKTMRVKFGPKRVAVVSPTGIAAIIAGGITLHSLTRIGAPSVVSEYEKCLKHTDMWLQLALLIIDEASMIEPNYLDWLDSTVRQMRRVPDKTMGWIQVICSGDFLSLPGICPGVSLYGKCPVKFAPSTKKIPVSVSDFKAYAFQTNCFRDAGFVNAELTTVFRQSEKRMVSALAKIRKGWIDDSVRGFVESCIPELPRSFL